MMIEVVRLAGMIAIASGLVALVFLLWRFIVNGVREEIDVERFRSLARNLRFFVGVAKKTGSDHYPHPRAMAEWLEEGLGWAGGHEGEVRDAEQFREYLKGLEAPLLKQRDEEIARLKTKLDPLEQLEMKVAKYKTLVVTEQEVAMMTESDRRKWGEDLEKTRAGMFELVGKIENR